MPVDKGYVNHDNVFLRKKILRQDIRQGSGAVYKFGNKAFNGAVLIMKIRHSTEQDFERIMEIYAFARQFMAEHGNPDQWGPTNWPPRELIRRDIRDGNSYVCLNDEGRVIGTFFFICGKDVEPAYAGITEGEWLDDSPYGVIHRIAGDGSEKGIGAFCINWAAGQCPHMRIDTYTDNAVMQSLLKKLGFTHCGTIFVEEDDLPRMAFEKTFSPLY